MDGPVLGPVTGSTSPASPNALINAFNPVLLADYLREVLALTLGATKAELESVGSLFDPDRESETLARLSRYASEPVVALYASKDVVSQNGEEEVMCKFHA